MPPKNSRNRRDRKPKPAVGQPQPASSPVVATAPANAPATPTVSASAVRAAQRRRTVVVSKKPPFGEPIFAWMHRQAVNAPWIGRLFAAESSLWTILILVVPILTLMLYLSTGIRRDQLPNV